MVCSKCGQELNEGVMFCIKCGAKCKERLVKKNNPWFYFVDVIKKYIVFQGRARRAEYWWYTLFISIFSIIATVFDSIFGLKIMGQGLLNTLLSLAILLPSISVGVRRMHDCNKSGWFLLIPIYSFILCCTQGTYESNRYGPNPKYVD